MIMQQQNGWNIGKIVMVIVGLATIMLPNAAQAMFHCEGSLTQNSFADERKQIQNELQQKIYKYRKLESTSTGSPEAKAQMPAVMAEIEVLKNKFKEFDSKYFPSTPVTAFGAACNDMRWLETAKAKLVEKPEHLGKHWFVWLDKATRVPQAALEKPSFDRVAE